MPRFVLTVLRALCVAQLLAVAPSAFAQAPGVPSTSTAATPAAAPAAPSTNAPATVSPAASEATPARRAVGGEPAPSPYVARPAPEAATLTSVPPPSAAEPTSAPSGLSPTYFWIAASTTIIVASLGGFQALHVRDLYDQAQGLSPVSPEREPIHDKMKTAEVTADVLLISSLALAVGTTILAFHIDWSGRDRPHEPLARRPQPSAARSWW